MIRLLIAEDDHALRDLLEGYLKQSGYDVYASSNGLDALETFENKHIDLAIIDIMLPKMDGNQLIESIREIRTDFPIIALTALSDIEDKTASFSAGVDDYMVKPVDFSELGLRIKALLRRYQIASENKIVLPDIVLDSDTQKVTFNDNDIPLTKKEFELLFKLLSYPNKIFTRNQLMNEIWGYDSESTDRTVDVHIRKLRERIQTESFSIETVRGLGYKAVIE